MKKSLLLLAVALLSVAQCFAQGCPEPTDISVSNITAYTAQVSWTGTANSYRILVTTNSSVSDPQSYLLWDIDTIVTTNPTTISISPNTRYYLYVQCICQNDSSDISSASVQFDSPCGVVMLFPWRERFEAGLSSSTLDLPCWTNEYLLGSVVRYAQFSDDDIDGNSSMKMMFPKADSSLIRVTTPSFNIPTANTHQFEFSIYRNTESYAGEGINVIMQNADSSYDTTFVPVNITVAGGVGIESAPGWYTYAFTFVAAGGNSVILVGFSNDSSAIYLDDFRVRAIPTCLPVTDVAVRNNQPYSTVIEWNATSAGNYQVVCTRQPINIDRLHKAPSHIIVYNNPAITADSAVITGITPGYDYYVYVRALCGDENSDWAPYITYRSACAPFTVTKTDKYTNGFENDANRSGQIYCWDINKNSTDEWPSVLNNSYYAHSGNKFLYYGGGDGTNDTSYIAMTEITNPVNNLRLRFWLHGMADDPYHNDSIIVGVMSDPYDKATFSPVARIQSSVMGYDEGYEEIEVNFGSYTGPEGRITLMRIPVVTQDFFDTIYYGSAIDDVTIDLIPSCQRVTGVSADAVTDNSAHISWQGTSAVDYRVIVADAQIDPLNPETSNVVCDTVVTADNVTVGGLAPVTNLYVYVRANCGDDDYADYSKEFVFSTAGVLPYFQYFDGLEGFPEEMKEYIVYNLDSVVAGAETPEFNPYNDLEVNNVLSADTTTIRYNFFGDENFRMLFTPYFSFDATAGTTLSFDVCKRAFDDPAAAEDDTNYDDLFYVLAANADMTSYVKLATWTNDTLGRGDHSLRNDIGSSFSHWTVDLSSLNGTYSIVFAIGSLVENDDYDIHLDNIVIAKAHVDSVTITVTSSDITMGTVSGSGRYAFGTPVTISATALDGYRFLNWNDGDTQATRVIYASEDISFIAYFIAETSLGNTEETSVVAYSADRLIVVEGAEERDVTIYDASGRLVASKQNVSSTERFPVYAAGVYFIHISGLNSQAIMVK